MDIGIIPAPLPPIIQVILVDCWVFMFVVIREVEIGLRPATFLHITMVDYTFSTQGSLKNPFKGGAEEKICKIVIKAMSYIHILIILIIPIILIQAFHLALIQTFHHTFILGFHHTLFVRVHISLLLLFVHLMEFLTSRVYHP